MTLIETKGTQSRVPFFVSGSIDGQCNDVSCGEKESVYIFTIDCPQLPNCVKMPKMKLMMLPLVAIAFLCAGSFIVQAQNTVQPHWTSPTVSNARWSPKGNFLVAYSGETISIYSAQNGEFLRNMTELNYGIVDLAMSSDEKYIATVSQAYSISVWSREGGLGPRLFMLGFSTGKTVDFSPDAKSLVSTTGQTNLQIWDVEKGTVTQTIEGGSERHFYSARYSPDGSMILALTSEHQAYVYQVASAKELFHFSIQNADDARTCWSASGRYIITHAELEKSIQVWDVAKQNLRWSLANPQRQLYAIATSSNDRLCLARSNGDSLFVIDLPTASILAATTALISPNDNCLIMNANGDSVFYIQGGPYRLVYYDVQRNAKRVLPYRCYDYTQSLSYNEASGLIGMSDGAGRIQVLRSDATELFHALGVGQKVLDLDFSEASSTTTLVTASTVGHWDLRNGKNMNLLYNPSDSGEFTLYNAASKRVLLKTSRNSYKVYDVSDMHEVSAFHDNANFVTDLSWSIDGSRVVVSGTNAAGMHCCVYDVATGARVDSVWKADIVSQVMDRSASHILLRCKEQNSIVHIDLQPGVAQNIGLDPALTCGDYLLANSRYDRLVSSDGLRLRLVNMTGASTLWERSYEGNGALSYCFSAKGTILYVSDRFGIHIYDAVTGDSTGMIPRPGVTSAFVDQSGAFVAVPANGGVISLNNAKRGVVEYTLQPGGFSTYGTRFSATANFVGCIGLYTGAQVFALEDMPNAVTEDASVVGDVQRLVCEVRSDNVLELRTVSEEDVMVNGFESDDRTRRCSVRIVDLRGDEVYRCSDIQEISQQGIRLTLPYLPSGSYYVLVEGPTAVMHGRFMRMP